MSDSGGETSPDSAIGQSIGPYEILAVIGEGRHGRIYQARHTLMEREVALKVIGSDFSRRPQVRERFLREIRVSASLRHPNVIQVFDAGVHNETHYLAMEHFPGRTLEDRFDELNASPEETRRIGVEIAAALEAAHAAGIIHRGIEPANILMNDQGEIKILDFGVAKAQLEAAPSTITDPTDLIGNPSYMAPEQAMEPDKVSPRVDIYSLGATLYFCLTGRPPYEGDDPMTILAQVGGPFPHPRDLRPDVPSDLEHLLLKCLQKDPRERFANAGELRMALDTHGASGVEDPDALMRDLDGSTTAGSSAEADAARPGEKRRSGARPMPYLRIFGPIEGCYDHNVQDKSLRIGRGEDMEIVLPGKAVSRHHATITMDEDGTHWIHDADSRAGTFLDGKAVKSAPLHHGDSVQVTHFVLQYRIDHSYINAEGKPFPLNYLPSSMHARYRVVHFPGERLFAPGDTLPVGQGGILVPIDHDLNEQEMIEVELIWPGGKRKSFLAEILGTLQQSGMHLRCLKLHQVDADQYEHAVKHAGRTPWIEIPRV